MNYNYRNVKSSLGATRKSYYAPTQNCAWTNLPPDELTEFIFTREWHFCPTDDNPADVASRPLGKYISSRIILWLQSASFLNQPGNCFVTDAILFTKSAFLIPENPVRQRFLILFKLYPTGMRLERGCIPQGVYSIHAAEAPKADVSKTNT